MTAWPQPFPQIAPSAEETFEGYVRVNDNTLRAHYSSAGMSLSLFAAHELALISSAMRLASSLVNRLLCTTSSNRNQSRSAFSLLGGMASFGIVTRISVLVFS